MKATFTCGTGDLRGETLPDPTIERPTDAIARIELGVEFGATDVVAEGVAKVLDAREALQSHGHRLKALVERHTPHAPRYYGSKSGC